MEIHLIIIQKVKILSLNQYQYSDNTLNTNLNIQDKVRWQFSDLKPLHKVLFVCLVLFLSLCIKFLQQGVQVYLKTHREIEVLGTTLTYCTAQKAIYKYRINHWHPTFYMCKTQYDA